MMAKRQVILSMTCKCYAFPTFFNRTFYSGSGCSTNSSFRKTSGGLFQLQGIIELQLHLRRGFWNNSGGLIVR